MSAEEAPAPRLSSRNARACKCNASPTYSASLCLSPWYPWFACLSTQRPRLRWRLRDAVRRTRTSRPSPSGKSLVRLVAVSAVKESRSRRYSLCFFSPIVRSRSLSRIWRDVRKTLPNGRQGIDFFCARGHLRQQQRSICPAGVIRSTRRRLERQIGGACLLYGSHDYGTGPPGDQPMLPGCDLTSAAEQKKT